MLESLSPLQTLPCVSLPAGCTSRLPESLDLSWSLIAVHGAGQMPGWRLLHVLDEQPFLPFSHTGREKSCGLSPLTRYGALIIVSLVVKSKFWFNPKSCGPVPAAQYPQRQRSGPPLDDMTRTYEQGRACRLSELPRISWT